MNLLNKEKYDILFSKELTNENIRGTKKWKDLLVPCGTGYRA